MGLPKGYIIPGEREGQDRTKTGRPDFTEDGSTGTSRMVNTS